VEFVSSANVFVDIDESAAAPVTIFNDGNNWVGGDDVTGDADAGYTFGFEINEELLSMNFSDGIQHHDNDDQNHHNHLEMVQQEQLYQHQLHNPELLVFVTYKLYFLYFVR
jgi:hypothetical protein